MSLEDFLDKPFPRDILVKLFIKKTMRLAAYQSLRNSAGDFPLLNAAASKLGDEWRIVVGARPLRAGIAYKASKFLTENSFNNEQMDAAAGLLLRSYPLAPT
ncbi:hypothetical protein N752_18470 [Desulforamulus aquiferis]|nr:hypothetical protein N752_18470 [Desulforamulus aquiferis]